MKLPNCPKEKKIRDRIPDSFFHTLKIKPKIYKKTTKMSLLKTFLILLPFVNLNAYKLKLLQNFRKKNDFFQGDDSP